MLIDIRQDDQAQSSGLVVEQMTFDMTKTAKLFHMLSSTMYSDKIGSIIRELSSNAHDSHYEAGKLSTPFRLTAPTYETPLFEIRDYGVGLTEERAKETILLYLGSDKDARSDMIGGWGVGSKSPFAYSTTYEIVVYKDSKFAHFTCWKDEAGLPNSAVIDRGETDMPDGVLVRVPVESKDVSKFTSALIQYMNWTNYNARLNNDGDEIEPRVPLITKQFDDYTLKIYRSGTYPLRKLVYGGFCYSMEECVDNRYDYSSDWQKLSTRLRHGYDVAFVIDTPNLVTFAMNREVLEQTAKSKEFVARIVNDLTIAATGAEQTTKKILGKFKESAFKTAVEYEDYLEEIEAELELLDTSMDAVFVKPETPVSGVMVGLRKLSNRGIHDLHNVKLTSAKIYDQFTLSYGRLTHVPNDVRSDVISSISTEETCLYVKADNEESALALFANTQFFEGYDMSLMDIVHVDIPKRNSTRVSSGVYTPRNPMVTCVERKERRAWSKDITYVVVDTLSVAKSIYVEYMLDKYSDKVRMIVPNPRTIAMQANYDNFKTLEQFDEIAKNKFYEDTSKFLNKADKDRLSRMSNHLNLIVNSGGLPSKLVKKLNDLRVEANKMSNDFWGLPQQSLNYLAQNHVWGAEYVRKAAKNKKPNTLIKRVSEVTMAYKKVKTLAAVLDFGALEILAGRNDELNKLLVCVRDLGYDV